MSSIVKDYLKDNENSRTLYVRSNNGRVEELTTCKDCGSIILKGKHDKNECLINQIHEYEDNVYFDGLHDISDLKLNAK